MNSSERTCEWKRYHFIVLKQVDEYVRNIEYTDHMCDWNIFDQATCFYFKQETLEITKRRKYIKQFVANFWSGLVLAVNTKALITVVNSGIEPDLVQD